MSSASDRGSIPARDRYAWVVACCGTQADGSSKMNSSAPIPPTVARQFMADLQAYYAEDDASKRDEIAGRQLHALRQYLGPREKKFRLADVKRLFELMREG
jgi:hypothetical protein